MTDQKTVFRSPRGEFLFPYLVTPDTKYNADGEFSVRLALEGDEAEEFKALIDAEVQEHLKQVRVDKKKKNIKQAPLPYQPEMRTVIDEDGEEVEEETGRTLFVFKHPAILRRKQDDEVITQSIRIFDAQNQMITGEEKEQLQIGNGTVGRIGFKFRVYPQPGGEVPAIGAGITLRLVQVKILKLVEWEAGSLFGDEDDDFLEEEGDGFSIGDMKKGGGDRGKKQNAHKADQDETEDDGSDESF